MEIDALRRRIAALEAEVATRSTQLERAETKNAELSVANDSLRQKLFLLEGLVEGSTDAIFIKDISGKYLFVNKGVADFIGKPAAEIIGKDDISLFGQAQWPEVLASDRRAAAGPYAYEETLTFSDGRRRVFLTTKGPIRDDTGNVIGIFGISREITQRKEMEDRLYRSEAAFRKAEQIAKLGYWEWDIDTGQLWWSEEVYRMYGLEPGEIQPTFEWLVKAGFKEERQRFLDAITATLEQGAPFAGEYAGVSHDGSIRSRRVIGEVVRDAHGRPTKMFGVVSDVTEQRRDEEARFEALARFSGFAAASQYGMGIADLHGRVVYVNPELVRMNGETSADACLGKDFPSYYTPSSARRLREEIIPTVLARGSWRGELELRSGNDRVTPTEESYFTIRDAAGKPRYIAAILTDITTRKRDEGALRDANARLVEADRRKNDYLAMLSHELRNPLAPILSSLYVLEHATPGDARAKDAQAIIARQVKHVARLVDDLLDISRINRGRIELRRAPLDMHTLVQRAVEDHLPTFVAGRVGLELQLTSEPAWVLGDETRLSQVISNLLQNAFKYTPAGGEARVSVSVDSKNRQVRVRVDDSGRGIPAEALPRLFEPFNQADTTLDRQKGGLGLGLALVKALVELHGGSVSASSEGSGQGATFSLFLPLQQAPVAAPSVAPVTSAGQMQRVLVIEDNSDAAESLQRALEMMGHSVAVAQSGPEGLAKARAYHPDVVLCDIGLPEMDGYAVARAFRSNEKEIGHSMLVAVTGYARPEDVAKAKDAGFDAHLAKPLNLEALAAMLAGAGER